MLAYTPRPGSKTEAAVDYLRAHGGAAIAIDLAEAIETERKNLPAQFKAAIDHGLIEPCDLPDGFFGYRLRGADAGGTPRDAPAKKTPSPIAATSANQGQGPGDKIPSAKRGRPRKSAAAAQAAAPKAPKKVRPLPAPPTAGEEDRRYPIPEFLRLAARRKAQQAAGTGGESPSAPVTTLASFRVGEYSDGSIRLEGLEPAMAITHNAGEGPHACVLSAAAARTLVEFLHPAETGSGTVADCDGAAGAR